MIIRLIKIANELDNRGLIEEADFLDTIIRKADDSMILPLTIGEIGLDEELQEQEGAEGLLMESPDDEEPVDTLDDLTMMIDNPDCDLECAENAALKYRSSLNYQENEEIERDIINALIDSKRPEPGQEG